LRSSRAKELADHFPSHVGAARLGHTEAGADKFYRQTAAAHFPKATEKAAQNPAQQEHEMGRKAPQRPRDKAP
jgi:hypothetical protein